MAHFLELQDTNECIALGHFPETLQWSLVIVPNTYHALGLRINVNKKETIPQRNNPPYRLAFQVNCKNVKQVDKLSTCFTYLGNVVTDKCYADEEELPQIKPCPKLFWTSQIQSLSKHNLENRDEGINIYGCMPHHSYMVLNPGLPTCVT